jgi:hypothetical protein
MIDAVELNYVGRGVAKIEHSEEWVWGVAVRPPAGGSVDNASLNASLYKFINEIKESRFQITVPLKVLRAFSELKRDAKSVSEFIWQNGLLREADLVKPINSPPHIEKFWANAQRRGEEPFAVSLDHIQEEQNDLKAFVELANIWSSASKVDRESSLAEKADKIATDIIRTTGLVPKKLPGSSPPKDLLSKVVIASIFSDKLTGAAIRFGLRNGRILPSFFAQYVIPALYFHVWRGLLTGNPLAICDECGALFEQTRPGHRFCLPRCKEANKQRRRRNRRKEELRRAEEEKN